MLSTITMSKIARWISPLALLVLSACDGGSSTSEGPQLQVPDIVEWQENKAFSYPLVTSGVAPFTFQLVSTPDAAQFAVDPVSGQLTANHLFDFESPKDSNKDGSFELTVNVIDGDSRADTKTFFIKITNVSEFDAQVTFPIEGANVGGVANVMRIRGFLTKDGERVASKPENVRVLVAGAEATFESENSSAWVAEAPLAMGPNNLLIEVAGEQNVESRTEFLLDNTPLRSVGGYRANTFGGGALYSIVVGGQGVIRTAADGGVNELLFRADEVAGAQCTEITEIKVTSDGANLIFNCLDGADNSQSTIKYSVEANSFSVIARGYVGYFEIVADQYVVARPNEEIFEVYGFNGGRVASTYLEVPYLDFELVDLAFNGASDGMIAFEVRDSGASGIAYLHVDQLIQSQSMLLTDYAVIDFDSAGPSQVVDTLLAPNNTRFYLLGGDLYRHSNLDVNSSGLAFENIVLPIGGYSAPGELIYADYQLVIVADTYRGEVYRLNLETGVRSVLVSKDKSANFRGDLFLNTEGTELVTFDWRTLSYRKVNTSTWTLEESKEFSQFYQEFTQAFAYTSYNWNDGNVYISKVLNWGGTPADEQAHLVAIDIEDETLTPLVNGFDLESYFADTSITNYRLGTPSFNPSSNEVWFSMMAGFEGSGGYEGVYRYDLTQQVLTSVHEMNVAEGTIPDTDYVSAFDVLGDQVALARWQLGYIKLLNGDGGLSTINLGDNPYRTTIDPEIDSLNNRVFATGFYAQEGFEFADTSFAEIAAFDIATGEVSVIASNEKGYGLPISWPQKRYDEVNNRIYGSYDGYIMLVDPDYGDRVILPIN